MIFPTYLLIALGSFTSLVTASFSVRGPSVFASSSLAFRTHHDALAARHGYLTAASIREFLDAHNTVRAQHGADALSWSTDLAEMAGKWADGCVFQPTEGKLSDDPYGENIVAATGKFGIEAAVNSFTQDEGQYDPTSPSYNHFTQVVWKSTTELGCAVARCNGIFDSSLGKATYYVCLYNPPGNIVGQALSNVQV